MRFFAQKKLTWSQNEVVEGKTPLTVAAVKGRADFVPVLVKLGCDVNRSIGGGITALLLATKMRRVEVAVALCEAGADPHHAADQGPSSLSLALSQGDFVMYGALVRHFIQAHEVNDRPLAEFEAMRASVAKGSGSFLEGLLATYPELKVTDRVVAYCARDGTGAVMEVLLSHGGSANAVERGQHSIPAVILASALGNLSCLTALLSTAETVDLEQECFGLTCLMHAAKEGHADCCAFLLDKGAKIDATRSTSGWTPLFFACNTGKQNLVRLLLERGAATQLADQVGQTALHVSSAPIIVEALLRYGADPNVMDRELRTPLFRPALVADYMSLMHLLRFGADPRLANAAHLQRVKDIAKRVEMPEFFSDAASIRVLDVTEAIDPVRWMPEEERSNLLKEYKDEQEMGLGKRSRLDLARDLLNRGLVWIRWTTSNHRLFPLNVRRTVIVCLLCRKRRESPMSQLPRDVLLHLCSFVATPSPEWRRIAQGSLREWDWNKEFSERCWEYDVSNMLSDKVAKCLEMHQCTKHLTGVDYLFQPFFKCSTCKWGEEFGNQLGMCRSCRDTCHKDHDTQVGGFLPAFCDCGDSARCCLDSQWSLLANEKDSIDPSTDGNEQYRFVIAICNFHEPAVFRELHRPENLMHAVPGDIIKVERAKLEQPGLMCEGVLHGEKGFFPASRSFVLPLREFVRALEDSTESGGADGRELKFKAGDLILPLGKWEENAPECKGVIMRGRLITPSGEMVEGWFSHCACDLVVNYEAFRKDGINVKRKLVELYDVGIALAAVTHPSAVQALLEFLQQFRQLVGERRNDTLGLVNHYFEAGLAIASMFRLMFRGGDEQVVLAEVCEALDDAVDKNNDRSLVSLRVRARAHYVMSLRNNNDVKGFDVWKEMVNKEELEHDNSISAALWRLVTFAFLETRSGSKDALIHLDRLRKGLAEAKVKEENGIWRIYMKLRIEALLAAGKEGDALREQVELIRAVETQNRPLEVLELLVDFATLLLNQGDNPTAAQGILDRVMEMWKRHPEYHEHPELVARIEVTAFEMSSRCLERFAKHARYRAMKALQNANSDHCVAVFDGRNLRVSVIRTETGYQLRVFRNCAEESGGSLYIFMEQPLLPPPFIKSPLHTIQLAEKWTDVAIVINFDSDTPAKIKIMWVITDNVVAGKWSFLLIPFAKAEEQEGGKNEKEKEDEEETVAE